MTIIIEEVVPKLVKQILEKKETYEGKNSTHQTWNIVLTATAVVLAALITIVGILDTECCGLSSGQIAGILAIFLSAVGVLLRVFPFHEMEIFYRDAVATLDSVLLALENGVVKTEDEYRATVAKVQYVVEHVGRDIPRGDQIDAIVDMRIAQLGMIQNSEKVRQYNDREE